MITEVRIWTHQRQWQNALLQLAIRVENRQDRVCQTSLFLERLLRLATLLEQRSDQPPGAFWSQSSFLTLIEEFEPRQLRVLVAWRLQRLRTIDPVIDSVLSWSIPLFLGQALVPFGPA